MKAQPIAAHALGTPESTFVIVEWADDGVTSRERPVAPLHAHFTEDEAWIVLEGSLGFLVDGREVEVGVGEGLLVPRGAAHTYWNARTGAACVDSTQARTGTDVLTRYVLVMGPRTAALVEALHGEAPLEDATELFRRHDAVLLG